MKFKWTWRKSSPLPHSHITKTIPRYQYRRKGIRDRSTSSDNNQTHCEVANLKYTSYMFHNGDHCISYTNNPSFLWSNILRKKSHDYFDIIWPIFNIILTDSDGHDETHNVPFSSFISITLWDGKNVQYVPGKWKDKKYPTSNLFDLWQKCVCFWWFWW